MTGAVQAPQAAAGSDNHDVGAFLTAWVKVLQETVARLDMTVDSITRLLSAQSGGLDRQLVVTLQEFDRLQQEFATLGEVIARIASAESSFREQAAFHPGREALAAIAISELRDRFVRHLASATSDGAPGFEDVIF